tara:strand:+ start:1219 stop:1887 length:669 start_codon:yes stop_codon:yes gene_type:complete
MKLQEFEHHFFNQKEVSSSEFNKDYFDGEWRKEKMSYNLESRREIEGKNPANIINYFKPTKALDVGCGPGSLVALLQENGFNECHGIDISKEAIESAPTNIRNRLSVGTSTDIKFENNSYDLVICREVLEHLTIRDVFRTVKEMCRISKKYVYVTTRFHPNPLTLFDFTTDFEVDPTHITCLNKDLLRLFFNLNGFKNSIHIEEKIDWLKKGRALVYEKILF